MKNSIRWLASVAAAAAVANCAGTGPRMGQVSVYLTDAPLANVASAMVTVSRVYLVPGSEEDGSAPGLTISDGGKEYDLLALQNGETVLLGTTEVPEGDYAQLRLVVESAHLTLDDGTAFDVVKVPSGAQTGIKVDFNGPIHVAPGHTGLLVDFDVSQNFVFTGPADSPTGVLFKPVLHGSVGM